MSDQYSWGSGVSEVASTSGMTRAAARRFLLTLGELGYARLGRHPLLWQADAG